MAETRAELIDRATCTYHMGASPCRGLAVAMSARKWHDAVIMTAPVLQEVAR